MTTFAARWDGRGFAVYLCWIDALDKQWRAQKLQPLRRYRQLERVLREFRHADALMFFPAL